MKARGRHKKINTMRLKWGAPPALACRQKIAYKAPLWRNLSKLFWELSMLEHLFLKCLYTNAQSMGNMTRCVTDMYAAAGL